MLQKPPERRQHSRFDESLLFRKSNREIDHIFFTFLFRCSDTFAGKEA